VSISLIVTAIYLGGSSAVSKIVAANPGAPGFFEDPGYWVTQAPAFVGMFINGTIDILTLGVLAVVLGNGFFFYIVRYPRFWRMLQALVVTLWLWAFFRRIGFILEFGGVEPSIMDPYILRLILIVVLGLVTISLTFVLTRMLRRRYASFFKRGGSQASGE
ncbi:MAG: hypothetical protein OEW84_04210, partial [Aigarchaeota archaeon]|nr:hypothetical protein [Aigarchaeota archaeon]